MESRSHEKKNRLICFKTFSLTRQTGRSEESIPRVFRRFKNGPSLDASSLRRTRSFSLPRILQKEKDEKQHFTFSFSIRTKPKQACSPERSSMEDSSQSNSLKQSGGRNNFVIPTICIQTPEEVNLILQLRTFSIDESSQLRPEQGDNKDCPTEGASSACKTTPDIIDKRTPRRKRSASWSGTDMGIYSSGEPLNINFDEVLKHSVSWSAFFDSDTSRETDLCSTEL